MSGHGGGLSDQRWADQRDEWRRLRQDFIDRWAIRDAEHKATKRADWAKIRAVFDEWKRRNGDLK